VQGLALTGGGGQVPQVLDIRFALFLEMVEGILRIDVAVDLRPRARPIRPRRISGVASSRSRQGSPFSAITFLSYDVLAAR
jgi:hypothetical protein